MTRPYITCRELIEYIADYLGGSLDETGKVDFERHLERCPSCRAFLASYIQTMDLEKLVLYEDDPVSDVPEDLVQSILARTRT